MTYYCYKDAKGEWRWRLKASNGKILADSGEGYKNESECKVDIDRVKNAPVVELAATNRVSIWKRLTAIWKRLTEEGILLSYKFKTSAASNSAPLSTGRDFKDITEIQLQKYASHYKRYSFYMEISLKVIVFFFVVTGTVLGFYLTNSREPYIKYSLLIPMVLGGVWGSVFIYGAYLWLKARCGVRELEGELIKERLIIPPPDLHLLLWLLVVFGLVFGIAAVLMLQVWWLPINELHFPSG